VYHWATPILAKGVAGCATMSSRGPPAGMSAFKALPHSTPDRVKIVSRTLNTPGR
jgi:hypothetical protein